MFFFFFKCPSHEGIKGVQVFLSHDIYGCGYATLILNGWAKLHFFTAFSEEIFFYYYGKFIIFFFYILHFRYFDFVKSGKIIFINKLYLNNCMYFIFKESWITKQLMHILFYLVIPSKKLSVSTQHALRVSVWKELLNDIITVVNSNIVYWVPTAAPRPSGNYLH